MVDPFSITVAVLATVGLASRTIADMLSSHARQLRAEWNATEFTEFRGQHFRYLKRKEIEKLTRQFAKRTKWRIKFYTDKTILRNPYFLKAIIIVEGKDGPSRIFVRCKLETYGTFRQILYEWSFKTESVRATSPESTAMQSFVSTTECGLGSAELRKSMKDYSLVGSRVFRKQSIAFRQDLVNSVVMNAVAVADSKRSISFKATPEARKSPWSDDMAEFYISVDDGTAFEIRFYCLDCSVTTMPAWELRCDWQGALSEMYDSHSSSWEIVQGLFIDVYARFVQAGAKACFPTDNFSQQHYFGIYENADYFYLEKAVRIIIRSLRSYYQIDVIPIDSHSKEIPGATEWTIKQISTRDSPGPYRPVHMCILFQPHPPRTGEYTLTWTGKQDDYALSLIKFVEKRMQVVLNARGTEKVAALSVMRTKFPEIEVAGITVNKIGDVSSRGLWPTPQDYNESIQSPETCFQDPGLKNGEVGLTTLGIPRATSGAFASVYKITCEQKDYALRCFNAPVKDQLLRYEKIAEFVRSDDLACTVSCDFLEQGIRVFSNWYPVVKMEWVDGIPLSGYISKILKDKPALRQLRRRFVEMMQALEANGIAHGDLQHGNIIIRNDDFVLVDYDNMYVPSLSGMVSWETGHRNYQHPRRNSSHFGAYLDHFSAWVIDTSLLCLIHEPKLWSRFGAGDENLLFTATDFLRPKDSELLQYLSSNKNAELAERGRLILSMLEMDLPKLPSLIVSFDDE